MKFNPNTIPHDSLLHLWLRATSNLETPYSYLILAALSNIGVCMGRNVWFDQEHFRVWPNLSVLLVGPSGVGKDTALDRGEEILQALTKIKDCRGRTAEAIIARFAKRGRPAVSYIKAGELTALLGKKDYQSGIIQDLTDILSTGPYYDYNLKSGEVRIWEPTLTVMAGSTAEWLQRAMPQGSTEGGFFPRFVITVESEPRRHVPLVKYDSTVREARARTEAKADFLAGMKLICERRAAHKRDIRMSADAQEWYRNWYHNRFSYFSPIVRDYANRSRDQILRLAMLSAVVSNRTWINMEDCRFADHIMQYAGHKLEYAIKPISDEQRVAHALEKHSGMRWKNLAPVVAILCKQFTFRDITTAQRVLQASGEIELRSQQGAMQFRRTSKDINDKQSTST